MTNAQHIPGPWQVEARTGYNERQNCEVLVISTCEYFIAEVLSDSTIADDDIANARLIAASPEMLDELKREFQWLEHIRPQIKAPSSVMIGFEQAISSIRAAIAKATGQAA